MRAVGDAGSYGVRDRRHGEISVGVGIVAAGGHAGRGSGSGDRSAGDSVRNPFAPQLQLDGRKSKDHGFLAAFFSIFLSPLKEIWPPEAYMQDAGATRNRRTENGPSGTPAPTGCATGDMARYVWAGCAHWGVQTRDAGAGGVFRQAVIEWRRKPQNQHRRALR